MKHSSLCSILVVAAGFLLSAVAAQEQPRGSSPGGHGGVATEAGRGANPTYGPWELFADLRAGIWSELEQDRVTIDLYRRNLQRSHVNSLVGLLGSGAGSDLAAVSRHELEALREQIRKKLEGADSLSRLHLEAVLAEITRAFDPANRPAPVPETSPFPRRS
jgi:hypothetical protein